VQRREPALRSSRAERVAADLEHEILSARLPVGAHLGRRSEIMDRFGISPTVMNETLRILRDRDLVAVRPGPGGGITVASAPPQVRLGALDLSFQTSTPHPLDLFEARLYLEFGLTKAAFERLAGLPLHIALEGERDAFAPRLGGPRGGLDFLRRGIWIAVPDVLGH